MVDEEVKKKRRGVKGSETEKKNSNTDVCALIVTYNRKSLLLELLNALIRQTSPVRTILIVDNHSNDGTSDFLFEKGIIKQAVVGKTCRSMWKGAEVLYYLNSENTGGAGGFKKAFDIANQLNHDFIWVMDDDVEPEENCLELLLNAITADALVCIPARYGTSFVDKPVKEYNLTNPFLLNLNQYKKRISIDAIKGDTETVVDMPFEGPLISTKISQKIGSPNSDYFLFFDDTDYAHRISQLTSIRFVKNARLRRKLTNTVNPGWTWKQYYMLRNAFFFDRQYGENIFVRHMRPCLSCLAKTGSAIIRRKPYRIRITIRAYLDALHNRMGMQVRPGTDIREI